MALMLVWDSAFVPPTCHSRFWNELNTCWSWANWYLVPTFSQCTSCANCAMSLLLWRLMSRCCWTLSNAAAVRSKPSLVRFINSPISSSRDLRAFFSGGSWTPKSPSSSTWSSFSSVGDFGLAGGAEAGKATCPGVFSPTEAPPWLEVSTASGLLSWAFTASAMLPIYSTNADTIQSSPFLIHAD